MAGNQVLALILIAFAAYFIVTYLKKIVFLLTVLLVTVFCFGIYSIVDAIHTELRPASSQTAAQADFDRTIGSQRP
jgi:cytochrome c-type biogenesis protein CcmH/NrfG